MKKTINLLLYILCHSTNEYYVNKLYFSTLQYYTYNVYLNYKILLLIDYKIMIKKYDSLDSKYTNFISSLYMKDSKIKEQLKIK